MTLRDEIEQVFGLTGGELVSEPWVIDGRLFEYWYDGVPYYMEYDFSDQTGEYRTVVENIMFGGLPGEMGDWTKVSVIRSSGETDCPGRNHDVNVVTHDQCVDEKCFYCEEPLGSEHSYIYIGDGWAEVVYRKNESEDE